MKYNEFCIFLINKGYTENSDASLRHDKYTPDKPTAKIGSARQK